MSPSRTGVLSRAIELFLFFLMGCAPYSELPVTDRRSFAASPLERIYGEDGEGRVYRAEIELYGRYFTGLLVIKGKGPQKYRVAFMSEMGMKFFDLLFNKDRFKIQKCLDKIDRKVVTSRLRKDLRLLLMPSIEEDQKGRLLEPENGALWAFAGGDDGTYYYHLENGRLEKAELVEGLMKKKKVTMRLSWSEMKEVPERIVFEHHKVDLKWSLHLVEDP